MSGTVRELLTWASAQVRTMEDPIGSNKQQYARMAGHTNGLAWCATFLVAGWKENGVDVLDRTDTASTRDMRKGFRVAGRLHRRPRAGDVGFLFVESEGRVAHAFFVNKVEGDFIRTIEGNSNRDGGNQGTGVFRQRRLWQGNPNSRGFGRPAYTAPAERPVVQLDHLTDAVVTNVAGGEGTVSHPRDVRVLEAALLAEELLSATYGKDGSFGVRTKTAYAQWQRRTGVPRAQCTGVPDLASLRKLGRRHGFEVRG
jgi:hypothetical protein